MILESFVQKPVPWLSQEGPHSDVVLSSRIRLARNLENELFLSVADNERWSHIADLIEKSITQIHWIPDQEILHLPSLPMVDRAFLLERHLISRDHATGQGRRSVVIEPREQFSVMINEEDHLRMQRITPGFQFDTLWTEISRMDDILSEHLPFAFSERLGYLTCCPTNVGTGMRLSCMVHLPAATLTRQIDKIVQALGRVNFTVRGFYGEGSQASAELYQISNQVTLPKTEEELIQDMQGVIPEIIKFERKMREKLYEENKIRLEDRIWRSYGTLHYAKSISSEEMMEMLSLVRLGVSLGILDFLKEPEVNELFISTQPAHLQKAAGKELSAEERDPWRAVFIQKKLHRLERSPGDRPSTAL